MSRSATAADPADTRPTRERLLDAASVVFARDGLSAATTREIAHAAGVNEVTLFRLFQNKKNLLTAVLERTFAVTPIEGGGAPDAVIDFEGVVREYAVEYETSLRRNFALRRVLIGEIQHFQEHELTVIKAIFEPARQRFITRLRAAQKAGLARKEMDPIIVADQISGMLFMGVLKASLPTPESYDIVHFVEACVGTVVRANEIPPKKK